MLVHRDCRVTEDLLTKSVDFDKNLRDLPKVTPGMFQGIYDETS